MNDTAPAPAPATEIVVIYTECIGLEKKKRLMRRVKETVDGEEKYVDYTVELGWFALFANSHEWLHVGEVAPGAFAVGDLVKISIQRAGERP